MKYIMIIKYYILYYFRYLTRINGINKILNLIVDRYT